MPRKNSGVKLHWRSENNTYEAVWYEKGAKRRMSLRTRDRADAEQIVSKLKFGRCDDVPVLSLPDRYANDALISWWTKQLATKARKGAEKRNIEFKLCEYDIILMFIRSGMKCEVSGIPFDMTNVVNIEKFSRGRRFMRAKIPSIDRIDSRFGYTPQNTRLVCAAVNIALGSWGDELLKELALGIVRNHINPMPD